MSDANDHALGLSRSLHFLDHLTCLAPLESLDTLRVLQVLHPNAAQELRLLVKL